MVRRASVLLNPLRKAGPAPDPARHRYRGLIPPPSDPESPKSGREQALPNSASFFSPHKLFGIRRGFVALAGGKKCCFRRGGVSLGRTWWWSSSYAPSGDCPLPLGSLRAHSPETSGESLSRLSIRKPPCAVVRRVVAYPGPARLSAPRLAGSGVLPLSCALLPRWFGCRASKPSLYSWKPRSFLRRVAATVCSV